MTIDQQQIEPALGQSSHFRFTGDISVKPRRVKAQNHQNQYLKGSVVKEDRSFLLNTGHSVNSFAWVRVDDMDGLLMSTTAGFETLFA